MGLFSSSPDPAVASRLKRIEDKLDLIIASLGVETPPDNLGEVRDLVAKGLMIEAIKRYRELTGVGLAEAKNAVERGV